MGTRTSKWGQEWEQSGNKVDNKNLHKWGKNGNKVGINLYSKVSKIWEQSFKYKGKNSKVGQELEQSGNKVELQKWDKNGNKVGTRTPKWGHESEQSGNKVGTRTKWISKNYTKLGQEWEQSG